MKNPRNKLALGLGILLALGGVTLTGVLDSTPASAEQKVVAHGLRLPDGTSLAGATPVAVDRLSGPTTSTPKPTPTPTPKPTPTPTPAPTRGATPASHGTPRVTGTASAGASVAVVPQAFKNVPGGSTEVVTWYVDGKAVGHAKRLKLKSAWKGRKLTVQVARTWTTKARQHGRTVTQHHTLSAKSKAIRIH